MKIMLSVFIVLILSSMVFAETAPTKPVEQPNTDGWINFNSNKLDIGGSVIFTNEYFFRGINQVDQGLIVQPEINATYSLNNKFGIYGSFFNSFDSSGDREDTGNNDAIEGWYEASFTAGFSYNLSKDLTASFEYVAYTSPSNAFNAVQELQGIISYDDLKLGGINLKPYIMIAGEIDNGRDQGNSGIYLETGIRPKIFAISNISFYSPIAVGFSLEDYYGNSSGTDYGFSRIGLELEIPVSNNCGIKAGVNQLFLGQDAQDLNHGDEFETIGTLGLVFKF